MKRSLFAVLSSVALLAGCTSAPPAAPTAAPAKPAAEAAKPAAEAAKTAAPAQAAAPAQPAAGAPAAAAAPPVGQPGKWGPKFQALLDKAKQGDGRLRAGLEAYSPEYIRAMEDQFQKEFGIKVTLENEPGHGSRDIPPKMMQAQKAGKGLVDWIVGGNPSNFAPVMVQDGLQVPQWDALRERWPNVDDLRKLYPNIPGGPNGTTLQDYCMLDSQTTWTLIYNTKNVKPEEVKNIKWNDLLTDKWKNRVAWDAQGLGFKELPFHKEWPIDRLKAFTNNLGANGVKMINGGTNGVLQALTQGEGDIGAATADTAMDRMAEGAPLGIAWPEVIPFNSLGTCIPKITANNEALANIFFAWRTFEGNWLRAEMGAGGVRPFYAPEVDKYPLGKVVREAGVKPEQLAEPKTTADFDKVEDNRKIAIDGMKAGLQSKQTMPYTW